LLRERPGPPPADSSLRVLLVKRPAASSFAPLAEVFPGGSVDPADLDSGWGDLGAGPRTGSGVERQFLVAAVRETFEECGILLARDPAGMPCDPELVLRLAPLRARLQAGESAAFQPALRAAGLRPGWEDLVYCAHWVTPEGLPRIFDTRFFLAALPLGQEPARADGAEVASLRWVLPKSALAEAHRGQARILPPTRAVLELVAGESDVETVLQSARRAEVVRVQPRLEEITASNYPGLKPEDVVGPAGGAGL